MSGVQEIESKHQDLHVLRVHSRRKIEGVGGEKEVNYDPEWHLESAVWAALGGLLGFIVVVLTLFVVVVKGLQFMGLI